MAIKFERAQIHDRMTFENPWWAAGHIEEFYNRMKRRDYLSLFMPLIEEKKVKRAVVLMGPRRVGKTVMLYHTIEQLIHSGINPKQICYFQIDTPIYNGIALDELVQLFLSQDGVDPKAQSYILFDEIQYLKEWEVHLKSLVDSYHTVKFVVSGSAAAALKLKGRESGAGRFTDFILPPLTFKEYLSLTGSEHLIDEQNIAELNVKFIAYINYGGYPEVSLSPEIQQNPGRYIRNDIIDKVLLRDLPSLYGIQDIQELNSLFTYIAYHTGSEMSLDSISQNAGVTKNTIKRYFTYLEAAFLIKIVHRIDQSGKKFKRANFFKVYLTNPSLRSALFSPIADSDPFIGNMVETAVFSQWQHDVEHCDMYYARWQQGEIDMVNLVKDQKPNWAMEIKWSNRGLEHPEEIKQLMSFGRRHEIKTVTVTTKDVTKTEIINGVKCVFMPAARVALLVGSSLVAGRILDATQSKLE